MSHDTKSLKINIVNAQGKNSSTTIDKNIAFFYFDLMNEKLACKLKNKNDGMHSYMSHVRSYISRYVRENELNSKEAIQQSLLIGIHEDGKKRGNSQEPEMSLF